MIEVPALALPPRRLGRVQRIGAGLDDRTHARAEALLDLGQNRTTALILCRVVEQRCNSCLLVATVLHNETGNTDEMREIGHIRALSLLLPMEVEGKSQRVCIPVRQRHGYLIRARCFSTKASNSSLVKSSMSRPPSKYARRAS